MARRPPPASCALPECLRFRLRRSLAIGLLLLAFVSAGVFLVSRVRAGIPDDAGVLELRVRALRNVNRRYQALMGLDPSLTRGNRLYRIAHEDLGTHAQRADSDSGQA